MKTTFAVFAALLVVAISSLAYADTQCTPGQQKKEACNTCFCTTTGIWGCTRKACPPTEREKRETCTPGAVEKRDCNTCRCAADGSTWACTKKQCLPASGTAAAEGTGPSRARRSPQQCEPSSTFKKDCNTCTCNKDGTSAVCTLKACLKPRTRREMTCTPGTTFMMDCNTCICNKDGKNAACTAMGCLKTRRETKCTPGTTYKDKCNTCRCSADGKNATCTLKACPAGSY